MEKICNKCNQIKPYIDFNKHPGMKDGYLNICKVCKTAYDKNRRAEKSEEINAKQRKLYHDNIEVRKQKAKISYNKHKDKRLNAAKQYRDNNRETYKEYFKILHQKRKHDEKYKIQRKNIKHTYRERKRSKYANTVTVEALTKLRNKQQNLCAYCRTDLAKLEPKDIHLDHVIPLSLNGVHSIGNLVFSCSKCNLTKSNKHPIIFGYPFFWRKNEKDLSTKQFVKH